MFDPARRGSYWSDTCPGTAFPSLSGKLDVDVAIVGGGIVGTTAARLLKDAGMTVALIEARKVGRGVTGRSTAKISSQHSLKYAGLAKSFGDEDARLYALANQSAIGRMESLAAGHGIECDWEAKAHYVYTMSEDHVADMEREAEVARRLGLPATFTRDTGLPFEVLAAVRFDDQAQFHPCKYVAGLAGTIPGDGCHVFEDSRVEDWATDRVATAGGAVAARHVIMATHLPLGQIGMFYAENAPEAHPVIAARVDPSRAPPAMYINFEQPTHSVRTHRNASGETWLIMTGAGFRPGHVDDEREGFADIEGFARATFGVAGADYRWVNEDYSSIDGLPYIGRSTSRDDPYLVATGFSAWGITNGTVAAIILADLIAGRDNQWAKLFDARRIKPVAGAREFIAHNVDVARHLVSGYLSRRPKSYDELAPGDAAILEIDGDKVAAFRDEQGRIHARSAACTHMGCVLGWNETDRTWDCPCHGSRFDLGGEVIHGPAVKPLAAALLPADVPEKLAHEQ